MTVRDLKALEKHYKAILEGEKTIEARAPELNGEFRYEDLERRYSKILL
jgi:hypothetical protein